MKTGASSALITFMENATEFVRADLYTFTLNGGGVLRYTSSSIPITTTINSVTSTWNVGPPIQDAGVQSTRGTGGASVDITILGGDGRFTIDGEDVLDFLEGFGLDGATIRIDRAFAANWPAMFQSGPVGSYCRFQGLFSEVKELGQTQAVVTVQSPLALLQTPFPPEVFGVSCLNDFGNGNCSVNVVALTKTSTVTLADSTQPYTTFTSGLTDATGYWTLGAVTFTSGVNAGLSRSIKAYNSSGGQIVLSSPLPSPPTAGDAFSIVPGCSLSMSSTAPNGCQQWQPSTWQLRFRAAPFTPPPSTGLPT